MKNYEITFLNILKCSFNDEKYIPNENFNEWNEIYHLSEIHKLSPMIFDKCYSFINDDIKNIWKKQSYIQTLNQTKRTIEFSNIYNILNKNNIKALVFKGIICRNTYPKSDLRISKDEDILIKKQDLNKLNDLFLNNGYKTNSDINSNINVISYFNDQKNSCIEVHLDLFENDSVFSFLNEEFKEVFDSSITININGSNYHTFEYTLHLFYLFIHAYKHFIHGGFGLRQIGDIVLYMNQYINSIDFNRFNSLLEKYNFTCFWLNLLDIAEKYLGYENYYINSTNELIDSKDLLLDLLDSGIYGQSTIERKHSSNITLSALNNIFMSNGIFKSLFPSVKYIRKNYKYVDDCILLLPIGYIHRILKYLFNNKNNSLSIIEIGENRIKLMKKYKLIK